MVLPGPVPCPSTIHLGLGEIFLSSAPVTPLGLICESQVVLGLPRGFGTALGKLLQAGAQR